MREKNSHALFPFRFVLSNLLYHKYLDPDEGKILKSLAGTQEKFLIHAQPDKARHLRSDVSWRPIFRLRKTE